MNKAGIKEIFNELDNDHSGELDLKEFKSFCTNKDAQHKFK
jgi:Ca2+-binding EF-hand superfamily protein